MYTLFLSKRKSLITQKERSADMKIKILEKTGNKLVFVLDGSTPAFANSLRRVMMSEIPVLAIDSIKVLDNNSILFDEVVSHRLGLIPLDFDAKKFNFSQ